MSILVVSVVIAAASYRCSEIPLADGRRKLAFDLGFHSPVGRVQNHLFSDTDGCLTGATTLTEVTGAVVSPVRVVMAVMAVMVEVVSPMADSVSDRR